MRTLLLAAYLHAPRVPARIHASVPPSDLAGVRAALSGAAGRRIEIVPVARRGDLARLARMGAENAHLILEEEELRGASGRGRVDRAVYALQEALGLGRPPYRIEGFDISNLQASHAVASLVAFRDGRPWKAGYRRYRMSASGVPDDFARMEEVLRRRFTRLRAEGGEPPDLILVDGGRGQVGAAARALLAAGFSGVPLVGLAKREEEIVRPGGGPPVRLPRSSEALRLLQRVRDEAHRFALGYHRTLRGRAQQRSLLDRIPGIGPARRQALLRHLGSLDRIRLASEADLAAVPGVGPRLARRIRAGLDAAGGPPAPATGETDGADDRPRLEDAPADGRGR